MSHTPSFPRQLASAGTLAALFTALALAELRFEGYETEKHALLVIPAAVILAALLLKLLPDAKASGFQTAKSTKGTKNPNSHSFSPFSGLVFSAAGGFNLWRWLPLAVLLLLLSAALSTAFSLDPAQSLFGAPNRGQGLLALVCYALLFAGAAWGGRALLPALLPTVVMIGVPLALYALLLRLNGIERPGATMGNPNFLAAWLTPAILYTVHGLWVMRQGRAPRRVVVGLGAAVVLMGMALLVASSRGALLAVAAGGLISALAYAAVTRQRRLTAALGLLVVAGLLVYLVAGAALRDTAGIGRLFQPLDPFRQAVWDAAADLLSEIHLPLLDAFGGRDPMAPARSLIGYGVDALPLTQSRFGYVTANTIFIDSFHNLIFDSLAATGALGLMAWLALYLAATGTALGALGLLTRARLTAWLLVQVGGMAAGALLLIMASFPLPVGAGIGLVGGTAVWLALSVPRTLSLPTRAGDAQRVSEREILVIGLLGIVAAHWTALQFGFPTASSSPLIWVLLGVLAALTSVNEVSQDAVSPTPKLWTAAALASGAVLIASLGVTVETDYLRHAVGVRELPVLLLALGGACAWFVERPRLLIPVGLVWLGWAMAEELITRFAGSAIYAALVYNADLVVGFAPLALKGLGGMLVALVAWAWYNGVRPRALGLAFVSLSMIGGTAFYLANHTAAVLHGVGGSYMNLRRAEGEALSRRFYAAGAQIAPLDIRIALDRVAISPPDDPAAAALLEAHPYVVNSLDWMRLLDQSILRYRRAPADANVIRNGGFDLGLERWFTFGDIEGQVERGAFVFRDLGLDQARAVVFQDTGVAASGGSLRAQLDLRSDMPADVNVILHTPDWAKQRGCVFDVGAAFAPYTVVISVDGAWNGIQLAIYSLTDGAAISVDNVGLWMMGGGAAEAICSPAS